MRFLIALALLAVSGLCFGQLNIGNAFYPASVLRTVAGGGGGGDSCTSCTNETFEGTGYAVAGWTEGGGAGLIVNEDYATAPAPLTGSQSLLIKNAATDNAYSYINMPSGGEVWMRFQMYVTNTVVNSIEICFARDNAFGELARVETDTGKLRVFHGTANAATVSTISAGTLYYVWFHYLKGTGANGTADIAFSTSKTRPTSGNNFAQITTGTSTANQQQIGVAVYDTSFSGAASGIIYDNVSLTTLGVIGDFP